MKKTDGVRILAFPALFGLILTLFVMLIGTMLVYYERCSQNAIPALTLAALLCGCLPAGVIAGRRASERKSLWGMLAGAIIFFCLALLSMTWFNEPISWIGMAKNGGVSVVSAALGGVLAGRIRTKHKKKNRR